MSDTKYTGRAASASALLMLRDTCYAQNRDELYERVVRHIEDAERELDAARARITELEADVQYREDAARTIDECLIGAMAETGAPSDAAPDEWMFALYERATDARRWAAAWKGLAHRLASRLRGSVFAGDLLVSMGNRAHQESAAALARAEAAEGVLREVEWRGDTRTIGNGSGGDMWVKCCPSCGAIPWKKKRVHRPDCRLAAIINQSAPAARPNDNQTQPNHNQTRPAATAQGEGS